ncbi:MAG: TIGR02206 family membrane protein [Candidatus Methylacidiphilales bacterium]|nr:TIGR02206 family membrane protein [Candidatus Methylacidiphilales bacterium]
MEPHPAFVRFGLSHGVVMALTVVVPALLVMISRPDPTGRREATIRRALAFLMAGNMAALVIIGLQNPGKDWLEFLPMHLCDWLGFIILGALLWKKQSLYDLAYFWGLAGTLHGVITPDLQYGFPHPYFFTFHIGHSGLLASVAFLTFGCGLRPNRHSLPRAILMLQVYFASAALANILLGENFGYLCAKPEHASLLDHLGPWPWYLLSLQAMALVSFVIYYLPWMAADAWKRRRLTEYADRSPVGDAGDH